jgi:hypothetical protein
MSFASAIGNGPFKAAAGEGAYFELRMRLGGGITPKVCDLSIDTNLSVLKDAIIEHHAAKLTTDDVALLTRACRLRNKLLHCEFSSARKHLQEHNPKTRDGGVIGLKVGENDSILELITKLRAGVDVGQKPMSSTTVKKLSDVFGWLLEMQGAGEFEEAIGVFQQAVAVLDKLPEPPPTLDDGKEGTPK